LIVKSEKLPLFELYLERGKAFRQIDNIDQSIADISHCFELQKYSTKPKILAGAYNELGLSLFIKGLLEESTEKYSKAIELDADNASYYNNRGKSYTAMKSTQLAFQDFNKALSLNPTNAQILHNRGIAYMLEEDFDTAHLDFDLAIELNPQSSEFHFSKGQAYFFQQQFENAKPCYLKCLEIDQNNIPALYSLAKTNDALDLNEQTMQVLEKLLKLSPDHNEGFQLKGIVYQKLNDHENALRSFDIALESNPQNAILIFLRGKSLLFLKENAEAIKSFTNALHLGLNDINVYKYIGQAYDSQNNYEKSLYYFNFGLKKDPENIEFLIERSKLYTKLNNFPTALLDLQKVNSVNPSSFIYFKIGYVMYKNKNYVEALENLAHCLEMGGLSLEFLDVAYYTMGLSYASIDNFAEAIDPLSEAIRLKPEKVIYYHERAKCHLLIDQFEKAIEDFSQTIDRQPINSHAYFGRGFAYKNIKEFRKAVSLKGRGFRKGQGDRA
jgi:tetratricopeptide (TPR) repeat protein